MRVIAAGTNPVDYKLRNGDMAMIMKASLPCVFGLDLSGVVEKVGTAAAGTFKVRGRVGQPAGRWEDTSSSWLLFHRKARFTLMLCAAHWNTRCKDISS